VPRGVAGREALGEAHKGARDFELVGRGGGGGGEGEGGAIERKNAYERTTQRRGGWEIEERCLV
jgi:hypothetical protein